MDNKWGFDPINNSVHNLLLVLLWIEYSCNGEYVDIEENIEAPWEHFGTEYVRDVLKPLTEMGIDNRDTLEEFISWFEINYPFDASKLKYLPY